MVTSRSIVAATVLFTITMFAFAEPFIPDAQLLPATESGKPASILRETEYGSRTGYEIELTNSASLDRIATLRLRLIAELQVLQDDYCRRAMLDEALAVREQIRQLQQHQAVSLPPLDSQVVVHPQEIWTFPMQVRGRNGESFYAQVTGSYAGSIWGSGVYTDDSDLAKAAVHAGVLKIGETKIVRYTILPGRSSYEPSVSNDVQSSAWESFAGSFCIDGAAELTVQPNLFREEVGKQVVVYVTGSTAGSVWGTGIYTDDSDLATAAVHAGLLKPGESGFVTVTIRGPQDSFEASTKHGVNASQYGSWEGSFSVQKHSPEAENAIHGDHRSEIR